MEKRELAGVLDGGVITSDAGGLLVREADAKAEMIRRFAEFFADYRDLELIEHSVAELVAQRFMTLP